MQILPENVKIYTWILTEFHSGIYTPKPFVDHYVPADLRFLVRSNECKYIFTQLFPSTRSFNCT
jgi:hypothetical protein